MYRLTGGTFIGLVHRGPLTRFVPYDGYLLLVKVKSGILHFHGGDCRYFHRIKHQCRRDHQGPDAPKARTILAIEPRQLSLVKDVLPALYLCDPKFAIHSGRKFIHRHRKRDVPYLVDHAMGNLIPRQPDRFGTIAILKLDRSDLVPVPLLLIPQILLCGLVVKFDDLAGAQSSRNIVPLIGEVIPSRWALEALVTEQFRNNSYNRLFFTVEKEKVPQRNITGMSMPTRCAAS